MSAKKNCVTCGKQIPDVAVVCVFCSAKQPAGEGRSDRDERTVGDEPPLRSPPSSQSTLSKHATDPTLLGIRASDVAAALQDKAADAPAAASNGTANGVAGADHPALDIETGEAPLVGSSAAAAGSDAVGSDAVAAGSDAAAAGSDATASGSDAAAPAGATAAVAVAAPVATSAASSASGATAREEISEASVEAPYHARRLPEIDLEPWGGLGRLIMGVGGAVLVTLFFSPWHGVSSWQLLETLSGADFVRQLFYLTGGIVLLVAALLPLPFVFRAAVGASVAAMPVVLGAGGVIEGWRGVMAALAILGLPATHLLRSRAQSSVAARLLVVAAAAAVALLYVLPIASVVPIAAVFKLIGSGSIGLAIMGVFVLIPLVFAALSLLGIAGRDLTDIGVLLSVLILLWAPVVVALRGLLMEDGTQLYVAVALLCASATAALSLAQLLSRAAATPRVTA